MTPPKKSRYMWSESEGKRVESYLRMLEFSEMFFFFSAVAAAASARSRQVEAWQFLFYFIFFLRLYLREKEVRAEPDR